MKHYEFWFVVGSQTLYGDDVLTTVESLEHELFLNDLAWKLK